MELQERLELWVKTKEKLVELRDMESTMREELCNEIFPRLTEGTNTAMRGDIKVKCVLKVNRSLDEAALSAVIQQLHQLKVDTRNVFEYKPTLKLTGYKNLNKEAKAIADECITSKPGSKTLEVDFGA